MMCHLLGQPLLIPPNLIINLSALLFNLLDLLIVGFRLRLRLLLVATSIVFTRTATILSDPGCTRTAARSRRRRRRLHLSHYDP